MLARVWGRRVKICSAGEFDSALTSCRALSPNAFQTLKAAVAITLPGLTLRKYQASIQLCINKKGYDIIIGMYRRLQTTYVFKNNRTVS